jgi:hypothetical protein
MNAIVNPEPGNGTSLRPALFLDSSLREKLIEHVFVGDLLRLLWRRNTLDVEVLRAEVDRGGYDLVLECNNVLRHIQFKSSHRGAKTSEVTVNLKLADKPSGCVIWVLFDQETLQLGPYLWFGGAPGLRLPALGDKIARHSKADSSGHKAERPNLRIVRRRCFTELKTMDEVIDALFGRLAGSTALNLPLATGSTFSG